MLKICKGCGEEKEETQFVKCTLTASGYRSKCKECNNKYYAKRRVEKYDKVREYERKFHFARRLKHEYNLTEAEYNQMLSDQLHCCAICGVGQWDHKTRFAVDHCHTTGKIRGLLCTSCNLGLGKFKDNLNTLENAIDYIKRARSGQQT